MGIVTGLPKAMLGRLRYELERRGQTIPATPDELPPLTDGARLRIAGLAALARPSYLTSCDPQ